MRRRSIAATAILILVCALHASAQDSIKGPWRASSNTASSITGDIQFSGSSIVINFRGFPIAFARALKPEEVSAVFDEDLNTAAPGALYRLNISATLKFLHHNTLCGSEETQWLATYVSGRTLRAAFFSGTVPPVFTLDAISNSQNLCGTYTFVR